MWKYKRNKKEEWVSLWLWEIWGRFKYERIEEIIDRCYEQE